MAVIRISIFFFANTFLSMNFDPDMKKYFLQLFFIVLSFTCYAQNFFKGTVVDEQHLPVAGVTITPGKNDKVAVSNAQGNFSFNFPTKNFSLVFSHVSYTTQSIIVNTIMPDTIVLVRNNQLLDETVVKAFERNISAKNTAAAVTVLNKNSLERFSNSSFVAAVNTVPGVKMDERSPGSYRMSIRGNLLRSTFGVRNVKVYWNGIPFTDASGNTYFNLIPLSIISRMEIIKGPSGSMYGSGTGGVVLLNSGSDATAKEKYIDVQATGGSYGLFSGNATYRQTGKNASSFSVSHQQSDGYRKHTNMRRDAAQYTGSYQLNNKQRISANVFYADLFYETPGGLTPAELTANPRQSRPAAGAFKSAITQKAAIHLKTIYTGLSHEINLGSRWINTTGGYGSYTDFENPTIRNYEKKYEKGIGGRTVFQYKGQILTGTFGGELQQGYFNSAVSGNRAGVKDTLQFRAGLNSRQLNVFAQADVDLPAGLILSTGISYNNFYYNYEKIARSSVKKESSSFKPQFVPRVSLLKKMNAISVYVSFSKGYSVPSIDEVFAGNDEFNAALKPETAVNYELGAKGDIIKNKLWLDAAYYFFSLKNTIVSRRDFGGGDFYTNAGKTKQQGAELSIHYLPVNNNNQFIRQIKLSSSFTNIRANFNNYQQGTIKYDGNQLTGTPPNVFVISADIVYANKMYINASFSYTDHIPLNDANTFYAASYWLYFVKLGYKTTLGSSTEANFFITSERSAKNPYSLGNDLNAAANRFFNPAAPQMLTVGVQCRFAVKKNKQVNGKSS